MHQPETPQPQPENSVVSLFDYFETIFRYRRMICYLTASAFLLSVIISLILPKIYVATAKIIPPQQDQGIMGMMMGQMGGAGGLAGSILGTGSPADQCVGMLESDRIKKAIIKRFNLMAVYKKDFLVDMYKMLDNLVDISLGKKDGIISISVEDEDPKRAAEIANAYIMELEKLTAEMDMSAGVQSRVFLDKRLTKAKADLSHAGDQLKDFQAKNKTLDITEQAKATIGGVAQLQALLATQEVQLATLRSRLTDTTQEVMDQKAAIARLKTQIARLEGTGGGSSILSAGSVPGIGQEYLRLMRDFKVQEALVDLLTKQYEMAKLTEAKNYSTIQIVQPAEAPDKKSKPKRGQLVLMSTFATSFLAVFLAFVLEHVERMPTGEKERWRKLRNQLSSRKFLQRQ